VIIDMSAKIEPTNKSEESVWDLVKVILQALLIAFVVRTFFFQPFNIPSGSMIPTLLIGDYLFVNKLSYGYSKYSFNFSIGLGGRDLFKFGPVPFEGRILANVPARGDIAVFKLPADNETDYIKRVIGLPGDRIRVTDGVLYINDVAVKRERLNDLDMDASAGVRGPIRQYREILPNGVSYVTYDLWDQGTADNTQEFKVPPNHYFMMGDNRDNSTDSRFPQVGYVPYENLVGRATIIFFSHDPRYALYEFWDWPFAIRWGRLFTLVN
jgi:signal peptidase I